jgi:hypothetical protein
MMYYLGAITKDSVRLAHYAGIYRGVLAAGEALLFGLDSIKIPYIKEAGGIFAFYAAGSLICAYMGWYHIENTMYFKEEHVVVPNHVIDEFRSKTDVLPGHIDEHGMVTTTVTEGVNPSGCGSHQGDAQHVAVEAPKKE